MAFLKLLFLCLHLFAEWKDPNAGKPFLPWLWEDQVKPTAQQAQEKSSLWILGSGLAATAFSFQYDRPVEEEYRNQFERKDIDTKVGAFLGSGQPTIAIALAQLYFDQENGLIHSRSIMLTSLNHITIALLVQRERPSRAGYRLSFPSGHVGTMFASATALSYSYGWYVGVPMFAAAYYVALSRALDHAHWVSDMVAAATLGIFWGHNSYLASKEKEVSQWQWTPVPTSEGGMLVMTYHF